MSEDEKKEVEVVEVQAPNPDKKVLPFNYLRLVSICEGDIETSQGKYIQTFLFVCRDLNGKEFICPVYCHDNFKEGLRKNLSRLKPLILGEFDKDATLKDKQEFNTQPIPRDEIKLSS